jgi:CTP:molybdopterin cytidylyltransferase MocA
MPRRRDRAVNASPPPKPRAAGDHLFRPAPRHLNSAGLRRALPASPVTVRENWSIPLAPVAAIVLAAGGGRRMGGPKALLRRGSQLLVERAIRTARDAGCDPVIVVLGAHADRVRAEADLGDAIVVENAAWATGMGSSLSTGLATAAETAADAAVVLLVDTPGITSAAIERVIALPYRAALVTAVYNGKRGHPVLLGRDHWSGVAALATGDVGARAYLAAHASRVQTVACDDIADDADIDTPEAAQEWGITYTVLD